MFAPIKGLNTVFVINDFFRQNAMINRTSENINMAFDCSVDSGLLINKLFNRFIKRGVCDVSMHYS